MQHFLGCTFTILTSYDPTICFVGILRAFVFQERCLVKHVQRFDVTYYASVRARQVDTFSMYMCGGYTRITRCNPW